MYTKLGYSVYRRVIEYYSGEKDEDAFGKLRSGSIAKHFTDKSVLGVDFFIAESPLSAPLVLGE